MVASLIALSFEAALLEGGCLPRDDLSTYSSAWERRTGAPDTSDAAVETTDGADGLGAGGASGTGATPSSGTAGALLDAGDASAASSDASGQDYPLDSGALGPLDASAARADAEP
jgi:hypothetical protein